MSVRDAQFWTTPLAARSAVRFAQVNLASLSNPCFSAWPGGGCCSVYTAAPTDPLVNLFYFGNGVNAYANLTSGAWKNWGNTTAVETAIRANGEQLWGRLPYNNYSVGTTWGSDPQNYTARTASSGWSTWARVPSVARPDPTPDGHMAVVQPNGSVLNTFATIVMANGDLFTQSVSFVDATNTMVGNAMGMRASMIPSHAGIVRQGEMTATAIPHVLALIMGPSGITLANPRYPAFALDRALPYTGGTGTSVPMGTTLGIPPSVNLTTAGLTTAAGSKVAHAMQTYGGVLVDTAGASTWGICSETLATDIPAWSGPLATDLGIIRGLCQVVSTPDFPF